jgi:hypothetical protein
VAIGRINRLPEGSGAEQYDAVSGEMDIASKPPDGLIFHSAGELEGRFQIFNVWRSAEDADRFDRERVRPALVAVLGEERVAAMPEAESVDVALHNYQIPGGG